jgi:hypothetical protein
MSQSKGFSLLAKKVASNSKSISLKIEFSLFFFDGGLLNLVVSQLGLLRVEGKQETVDTAFGVVLRLFARVEIISSVC